MSSVFRKIRSKSNVGESFLAIESDPLKFWLLPDVWAAAGFVDTLLRWKAKPDVVCGNETAIQPGVQA
jgi:hypothetical protein